MTEKKRIMKIINKNILVTGGTGFVGSHLVEELVKKGAQVVVPYRSVDPYSYFASQKLAEKTILVTGDVKNKNRVFDIVVKYEIDYIFHLAAQAIVTTAYHNPWETIASNIIGTTNILETARLYPNIKGIIVASSDKAYGKLRNRHPELDSGSISRKKYIETDPLRGDRPYEVSKSSADLIAYSYYKTYDLSVVITRFGNIYGEGDLNFSRIIPGIMKSIIRNEALEIRSDGKYVRDYLYVKDVVNGYLLLAKNIKKIKGEAFNFGSNETLSVIELIKLIEKKLNKKINYKILNIAKNEIPYQSLNYDKIKKRLGWKPKYSISETIQKISSWYKEVLS